MRARPAPGAGGARATSHTHVAAHARTHACIRVHGPSSVGRGARLRWDTHLLEQGYSACAREGPGRCLSYLQLYATVAAAGRAK